MRRLLLAIGAVSLLACGDSTGVGGDPVGRWDLVEIDNDPLPYTLVQFGSTYRVEILSDVLFINADGTYDETSTIRETDAGTVTTTTETTTGVWDDNNGTVTLTADEDGSQLTGFVSGDRLVFSEGNIEAVYVRD